MAERRKLFPPLAVIRSRVTRARSLSRAFSRRDAFQLAWGRRSPARAFETKVLPDPIFLRPGTIDIDVFEKVFLNREYEDPFGIRPVRIIDAGAHIGLAARYFANNNPESEIIAIEPMEENFSMLKKNIAGFSRITAIKTALWGERRRLTGSGQESWSYRMHESESEPETCMAETVPDLLRKMNWETADLLKLDIEGSERSVFCDHSDSWLGKIRCIAIELHDRFQPGCSHAFYTRISHRLISQEIRGENIFVHLKPQSNNTGKHLPNENPQYMTIEDKSIVA